MKLLIDNALPTRLVYLLTAAGYDAVHVGAYGMHAASDEEILARALQEDRIVVSADSDFGVISATQEAARLSFILVRDPSLLVAHDYANMLIPALGMLAPDLVGGASPYFEMVAFESRSYRFRHRSQEVGLSQRLPPLATT